MMIEKCHGWCVRSMPMNLGSLLKAKMLMSLNVVSQFNLPCTVVLEIFQLMQKVAPHSIFVFSLPIRMHLFENYECIQGRSVDDVTKYSHRPSLCHSFAAVKALTSMGGGKKSIKAYFIPST